MSKDVTTPIPFLSDAEATRAQERLARLCGPLDAAEDKTDTTGSPVGEGRMAHPAAIGRSLVGTQAVLLMVAHLRAQTQDALSRPVPLIEIHQDSTEVCANDNGTANRELPSADFIEPVEYGWTETAFEARRALRRYSEETHADY